MTRQPPRPRDQYRAWQPIQTRWADNDLYGHVNNVAYYAYFDTAVNAFLIDQGVLDLKAGPVIGLVVETGCAYFAPLSFPDALETGLRVARLGTSSVTYQLGIFKQGGWEAAAQGHFVHVYVDRASRRPVPLPAPLRAVLEPLLV